MRTMPGAPIAKQDKYTVKLGKINEVKVSEGLLKNDLSLDGSLMEAVLETGPGKGQLMLHKNGAFLFVPDEDQTGEVTFTYRVIAGLHRSEPVSVKLTIEGTPVGDGFASVYPNPTSSRVHVSSKAVVDRLEVYSHLGRLLQSVAVNSKETSMELDKLPPGIYLIKLYSGKETLTKKVVLLQ